MNSGLAARSQVYAGCVNMMLRRPGMTVLCMRSLRAFLLKASDFTILEQLDGKPCQLLMLESGNG
jgi:hypothetical protein